MIVINHDVFVVYSRPGLVTRQLGHLLEVRRRRLAAGVVGPLNRISRCSQPSDSRRSQPRVCGRRLC